MPDEKTHPTPEQEDQSGDPSATENKKTAWSISGKCLWRTVVILAVLTVILQAGGWIYYAMSASGKGGASPEIALGQYQFSGIPPTGGRVSQARFSLYVTLLKGMEKNGREAMTDHKYRVQQDVEQLLRQAHSGDFDDPDLGGLKLQIREKIDKAVGCRVVSDVIITDLKLSLANPAEHPLVAENTAK
jgi:flagellar basal body-associated protein FliL